MRYLISSETYKLTKALKCTLKVNAQQLVKSCLLIFCAFCLLSVKGNSADVHNRLQVKDSLLRISFGDNNVIEYHYVSGTYDVTFHKGVGLKNATAIIGQVDTAGTVVPVYASSQMTYTHFTKNSVKTPMGRAINYKMFRKDKSGVVMEQDFTVFKEKNYYLTKVTVSHTKSGLNYASPVSNAAIQLGWKGENFAMHSPFDNDMWARFESRKLSASNFTSSEVTAVYNYNRQGLVVGSLEHETWKSGVHINAIAEAAFNLTAFGGYTSQKYTHDLRAHGRVMTAEGTCSSPDMMVGYFDDWRQGMEVYAANNRLTEPPVIKSWTKSTPVGWNSWGVLKDKINLKAAKGVVDFFADSCKTFRTQEHTLFIDLDSYWDAMVKGGLDGNTDELKAFVAYCKAKGFEPGIYWAPFTDWGKQGDRKVEGSDYTYKSTWTLINGQPLDVDGGRAMDPTHPATQKRMEKYINFFKSCGFKMIKIDFLGHATLEADHFYDPSVKTGMQAFRAGMTYLDSLMDNTMLVYAAISPNLATGRYVHMRRIACDAFKDISETAYTLNSVTYGWWQAYLYDYMDADHVVFKEATIGENRARLASAVVTGSLITGDDYSADGIWRKTARKLLQNKSLLKLVSIDGKSFRPYNAMVGDKASPVFEKRVGNKLYLAVFNYGEQPSKQRLNFERLDIKHFKSYKIITGPSSFKVVRYQDNLTIELPSKDAVIICVDL